MAVHNSRTVPVAVSRANVPRLVVPGAAADGTVIARAGCPRRTIRGRPFIVMVKVVFRPLPHIAKHVIEPRGRERADGRNSAPRRTIRGRPFIVIVKAVFHPLPDIAKHVIEPERIGRERADGRGLSSAPLAAAAVTIGVVFAYLITPIIGGRCASASRILPFGLGEQPVFPAGHFGEPGYIGLCVVPAHVDDRPSVPSPTIIDGPVQAAADRKTGIPFSECHVELRNGEGLGDPDTVLRFLVGVVLLFVTCDPIVNSPAGMTTISGQSLHSLN